MCHNRKNSASAPKALALMRLLDEIHLERPFYGSRRLRDELETQGHPVNRKRVQRLMRWPRTRASPIRNGSGMLRLMETHPAAAVEGVVA